MSGRGRGRGRGRKTVPNVDEPIKTSKKKFPIVAVVTPDGINGNLMQKEQRPLIVHLPIYQYFHRLHPYYFF